MPTSIQNFSDAEFLAWLNAAIATMSANLADYPGITAAMVTVLGDKRDTYSDSLLAHNQAQEAARSNTITKNDDRHDAEDEATRLKNLTKANGVSDAHFAALGFPSGGGTASESGSGVTVPVATVDTSKRLQHTIHFADASAPNLKRRPAGVVGLEIYAKIDGPPPGNETDCVFLALDTQTPYVAEYQPEHAGKTVHYLFRWQLRDGSKSAFGETVSATITA